jgi:hypothetical protein
VVQGGLFSFVCSISRAGLCVLRIQV